MSKSAIGALSDPSAVFGLQEYEPIPPSVPSTAGAFGRSLARGALPAAGGLVGAGFGAEYGALGGAAVGGPLGGLIGGVGGALVGGFGGGALVGAGQTAIGDEVTGGDFSRSQMEDERAHPYATLAGEALPQLAFMRPSARLALGARAIGAAIGGGVQAGSDYASTGSVDLGRVAIGAGFGAALDTNTALGDAAMGFGARLARTVQRGVGQTAGRLAARTDIDAGLQDVPDAAQHIARGGEDLPANANLSAGTREDLARAQAIRTGLGDRVMPAEQEAVSTIEGDALVEAGNPYQPTPAGKIAHGDAVAAATQQISRGDPVDIPAPSPSPIPAGPDGKLDFVIDALEGGDRPVVDSGGLTRFGISSKAHPDVDVARLTRDQAKDILRRDYWDKLKLDDQPSDIALVAFDAAVNHGPAKARRMLEEAGGDPRRLIELRREEYARLIRENPEKYQRYEEGWNNRLQRLEAMVGDHQASPELRPEFVEQATASPEAVADDAAPPEFAGSPLPEAARASQAWPDVVRRLSEAQTGEAPAALWHPSIGDIDAVWGDAKGGLAHIADKHPDVVADLPRIVSGMDIVSETANRIRLESPDHRAVVRLDFDGEAKRWLLTAFRREDAPAPAEDGRAGTGDRDGSPDRGARSDIKQSGGGGKPADLAGADAPAAAEQRVPTGEVPIEGSQPAARAVARDAEAIAAVDQGPPSAIDGDIASGFGDRNGAATDAQIDSLEHDIRMAIEADPTLSVVMDDNGDVVNIADLLAGLDDEERGLDALRACMVPGGNA